MSKNNLFQILFSRPLERQDRMYPKPVSNINATRITDKDISLTWDPPDGDYDSFDVQYLDATKILIQVKMYWLNYWHTCAEGTVWLLSRTKYWLAN